MAAPASAKVFPSQVLPGVSIDDRGRPAEGARLEAGLKRLQGSKTVRRMEVRRRALGPVVVGFAVLDVSTVPLSGPNGRTDAYRQPERILINERIFVATSTFIETLAHELYGHGVILREAPANADLGHTIDNEGFSLAVGAAAALELGAPLVDEDGVDAISISTKAYADQVLFADAPDRRLDLSLAEARRPREAIAARLKELARRRLSLAQRARESFVWRWQLEHFEKVHRVDPRRFAALRASLDALDRDELAPRRALLDAAEPYLKALTAWLDEPEGRAFEAGMIATSTSPYMLAFDAEFAALGRRIAALRAKLPPPPPAPASPAAPGVEQATWGDVTAMSLRDRGEHPEHWVRAPDSGPPALPWILP